LAFWLPARGHLATFKGGNWAFGAVCALA
jgi:hypothetical protein